MNRTAADVLNKLEKEFDKGFYETGKEAALTELKQLLLERKKLVADVVINDPIEIEEIYAIPVTVIEELFKTKG